MSKRVLSSPKRPGRAASRRETSVASGAVRVNPDVAFREIDGHLLLLGPGDSTLFTLNASGRFLWPLLVRGRSVDQVARALERQFGVPPERARRDVETFILELSSGGFVLAR